MIVDANDFGVEILGKSNGIKSLSNEFLSLLIKDNPAGQSNELTPFILIKKVAKENENSIDNSNNNLEKSEKVEEDK